MPNHLLLPAMGGIGALTSWGLGGDPIRGGALLLSGLVLNPCNERINMVSE